MWRPALRSDLGLEGAHELQSGVSAFPDLPEATRRVLRALQNPQASAQQIGHLIGSDPALAARILRVVNSASYNLPTRVGDLPRAIVLMGYTQLRNLVLQDGMGTVLVAKDGKTPVDLTGFWFHSFCTAICSFQFAKKMRGVTPGLASTVGLMHDLGKPVHGWMEPGSPSDPALSDEFSLRAEEEDWGANHAVLGAVLAVKWDLPGAVVRGIEFHHHPEFAPQLIPEESRELVTTLWLADQVAHWFTSLTGRDAESPDFDGAARVLAKAWSRLDIPPKRMDGWIDQGLQRELMRARALLDPGAAEPAATL